MTEQEYKCTTHVIGVLGDIESKYRSTMLTILSMLQADFNKKYAQRKVQITVGSGVKTKTIKGYCIGFRYVYFTITKGYKREYFNEFTTLCS